MQRLGDDLIDDGFERVFFARSPACVLAKGVDLPVGAGS